MKVQHEHKYKYDVFGRRIEYSYSTTTERFFYDGDKLIEKTDGSATPSIISTWIYGNNEVIRMDKGTDKYYYHENVNGSINKITNSNGQLAESVNFEAYGKPDAIGSSIGNPFWFRSHYYNSEIGSYYTGDRYYIPNNFERFYQRDGYYDEASILNIDGMEIRGTIWTFDGKIVDKAKIKEIVNNPELLNQYLYLLNNPTGIAIKINPRAGSYQRRDRVSVYEYGNASILFLRQLKRQLPLPVRITEPGSYSHCWVYAKNPSYCMACCIRMFASKIAWCYKYAWSYWKPWSGFECSNDAKKGFIECKNNCRGIKV